MSKITDNTTLKRLRNHYRLVIMNDDTFEEVIKFRLSRISVYIVVSTVFLLLVGLTAALLVLTPLKFYIPGYGKKENKTELQLLKMRTDSLQQALEYKEQYLDGLRKVLGSDKTVPRDTTTLKVPKAEVSND
ncbi:MAG TPA: hypothetical protein VEV62_13000 [Parafilimonas sp.]|nr:hypothetical protein [Parafilimonas sp.]